MDDQAEQRRAIADDEVTNRRAVRVVRAAAVPQFQTHCGGIQLSLHLRCKPAIDQGEAGNAAAFGSRDRLAWRAVRSGDVCYAHRPINTRTIVRSAGSPREFCPGCSTARSAPEDTALTGQGADGISRAERLTASIGSSSARSTNSC